MGLRTAGSVLVVFLWSVAVALGQDGWSVTYPTQSICTFKESTVELSCSYTYPSGTVTTAFWYTESGTGKEPEDLGQDPEYAGRLEYHGDKKNGHTLRITDLRESDSAEYKFRFITDQTGGKYIGSPGVTLSVTGLQVKVTGGHQDKTLTCSTTCTLTDNPTYIWYKNGHKVKEDTSSSHTDSFSNADSYSCAVKGHEDLPAPAVCKKCWSVTYTHQKICALKGSTVNISCSYTYPNVVLEMDPTSVSERENVTLTCRTNCTLDPITVYSWFKNGQPIPNSNTSSPIYILFSVSSEDTGRFSCAVEGHEDLPSAEETLTVRYGPKDTSVSVSPSGEIVEGSSVNLTCSSDANPPVENYTWYKRNVTSPKASGQSYTIHNVSSEDREGYYCEALNIIGRETIPVHINVISVFSWVPVVWVGAVLTAGALLVTIYCYMKRRSTGGSDATADTLIQGLPCDTAPQIDGEPSDYENWSEQPKNLESDTDPQIDAEPCDYENWSEPPKILESDTDPQIDAEPSDYENWSEPPQNLD
ncbi:B-cell receptor CD22-like [Oncorhynchus kisutch]|uniref:B-cell receptor CD22-like n=1 Tax=Oncorhynchus kisutch TaxID=8019 RepID=UPI0012DC75C5|nr:B-cell receptor CD22-like [Oncorhynchus kisutch]